MSTPESIARDVEQDQIHLDKIYAGWWECSCGCGEIYHPDREKIEINGNTYALRCLREEYGLVPEATR